MQTPPFWSRRRFLSDVGKGTLIASIGPALASELGMMPAALAGEAPKPLSFGELESLVCFMQETPVDRLQPALAKHLKSGVPLDRLLAAAALANARTFGGEDYVGFHTLMALTPALKMAQLMPENQRPLPVFKVLYRNTNRIQESGGREAEVLHPVELPVESPADLPPVTAEQLREAVRGKNEAEAERLLAILTRQGPQEALDALLLTVQEDTEVHRTVLPYRAWDLLDVVGPGHAETLLRQSLHYCLKAEDWRRPEWDERGRLLTRILEEHRLLDKQPGSREADDAFVERLRETIFEGTPEQAAEAVAGHLAEGFDPAVVAEAISLAANQLVLRDLGRPPAWEAPGKPPGSVHGDSVGVHACDSANAWRNLSSVSTGRNVYACLILSAWQAARDSASRDGAFREWEPIPTARQLKNVKVNEQPKLLAELEEAIRDNLQGQASAVVQRYGALGLPERPVFDVLLRFGTSEDGALHAEKYFKTVWDEFHASRPAFRWRHLTALARVTASEYGRPAPGQAEARELLGV